jgi:hypothetical protein
MIKQWIVVQEQRSKIWTELQTPMEFISRYPIVIYPDEDTWKAAREKAHQLNTPKEHIQ